MHTCILYFTLLYFTSLIYFNLLFLTLLPTYLLACLLITDMLYFTFILPYLLTYLLTYLLNFTLLYFTLRYLLYLLALLYCTLLYYLLACLLTYFTLPYLTCLLAYLLTDLLTYWLAYLLTLRADTIVCPRIYKTFMYLNIHIMTCCSAKHDHTSSIYIIPKQFQYEHMETVPRLDIYIYIITWEICVLLSQQPNESFVQHISYYNDRNMLIRITWSSTFKHILV